jgi:hypothetical protein
MIAMDIVLTMQESHQNAVDNGSEFLAEFNELTQARFPGSNLKPFRTKEGVWSIWISSGKADERLSLEDFVAGVKSGELKTVAEDEEAF